MSIHISDIDASRAGHPWNINAEATEGPPVLVEWGVPNFLQQVATLQMIHVLLG